MSDPYQILGVSPNASDDEIKDAYRVLAKKYHPDINPNKQLAEEKMKEINLAYDTIKKIRSQGSTYQSSNNYNSYQNSYHNTNTSPYYAVEQYIINRQFYAASTILNNMSNYDALWYYYSSIVNYNLGNRDLAKSQIQTACSMEPYNTTFQRLNEQMHNSFYRSSGQYNSYGYNPFKFISWIFRFMLITAFLRFLFSILLTCAGGPTTPPTP